LIHFYKRVLMLRVWIGGWRHVEPLDPLKSHTVYQVEVTTQSGSYFRVERRYSAFHSLHKECKKRYGSQMNLLPEFPPKKLRNTSARVLESRRTGLEHYIQGLAKLVPTPPQLIAFLDIPTAEGTQETYTTQVFGFSSDPFLPPAGPQDALKEMIVQASLHAFYL